MATQVSETSKQASETHAKTVTNNGSTGDPKPVAPEPGVLSPKPVAPAPAILSPKPPPVARKVSPPKNGGRLASEVGKMARVALLKYADLPTVDPTFTQMPHVPSGSMVLNDLIGGSMALDGRGAVCPGYPRRRITEIYGPESCGKTTAALAAVVQCQKAGGVAAYLDFEHAVHDGYAKKIGVQYDTTFLLCKPVSLEQGFKAIFVLLKLGVDLIVVDSVAQMLTEQEYLKKVDEAEVIGSLARPLTRHIKKLVIWLTKFPEADIVKNHPGTAIILINQTRAKIGGSPHASKEDHTPGGQALKFYSSIRLRMTRIRSEVIKKRDAVLNREISIAYGNVTVVKLVKTKIDSKQGQEGVIFIRYGQGIDDIYSLIENGIRFKFVRKDGSFFQYGEPRVQGREAFRAHLLATPKVLQELQGKVTQAMFSSSVDVTAEDQVTEDEKMAAELAAELGEEIQSEGDEEDGEPVEATLEDVEV